MHKLNRILPYTKKYGPIGEIRFSWRETKKSVMGKAVTPLGLHGGFHLYWSQIEKGKGRIYAQEKNFTIKIMEINFNVPKPLLLIELGIKELFD